MDDTGYSILENMLRDTSAEPTSFSLHLLEKITERFSSDREIGRGGFSVVYKGVLPNGMEVAVKKLQDVDDKIFEEATCSMKAKHDNIVRFLGYCANIQEKLTDYKGKQVVAGQYERLLCFEYLCNGNLRSHLIDKSDRLQWRDYYRIIMGICKGLRYLHEEKKIIHLDLKPENILLDRNMVAKISDFGLSRVFDAKKSQTIASLSQRQGTLGYMAPEYLNDGVITKKSDIYSLGKIILKIITVEWNGTRPNIESVLEKWKNKLQATSSHSSQETNHQQIMKCIKIALKCVEDSREKRPDIGDIINMLNETETTSVVSQINSLELASGWQTQNISTLEFNKMVCMDVHPTKPWIVTGHYTGDICIWNYETKEKVKPFKVIEGSDSTEGKLQVLTVKFIAQKDWVVAGGGPDGRIYVYCYRTMKNVESFEAISETITSLAIHPTKPYVLLASYDFLIKLLDWDNGWRSTRKFKEEHSGSVLQVVFNPKDAEAFASVSEDRTIKIWRLDSSRSKLTLDGHKGNVRCLEYFTHGNKQHLITGHDDGTAKIWDLQDNRCVATLDGHENRVTAVCYHPDLPVLMTGSRDETVRLWNPNSYRLERTLNFHMGKVYALACINSRRVVIGHYNGVVVTEI